MMKKILVLGITALLSASASAGYVRYNFTGDISGYFVQSDVDKSIIDYTFTAPGVSKFQPGPSVGYLYDQRSSFWGEFGPTNFSAYDRVSGDSINRISVYFNGMYSDTPNNFSAYYSVTQGPEYPSGPNIAPFQPKQGWLYGSVVQGTISAYDLAFYEQYGYYYVEHVIPVQNVPEPASLALLAVGALGAAGVARRRKAAA